MLKPIFQHLRVVLAALMEEVLVVLTLILVAPDPLSAVALHAAKPEGNMQPQSEQDRAALYKYV